MAEARKRPGFMLYEAQWAIFEILSDADAKRLLIAMFSYAFDNADPDFADSPMLQRVWKPIKMHLDEDGDKYANTCLKNQYNRTCAEWNKQSIPEDQRPSFDEWKISRGVGD